MYCCAAYISHPYPQSHKTAFRLQRCSYRHTRAASPYRNHQPIQSFIQLVSFTLWVVHTHTHTHPHTHTHTHRETRAHTHTHTHTHTHSHTHTHTHTHTRPHTLTHT